MLETIRDGQDCIRRTVSLDMDHKVLMRLATTTAIFSSNAFERKMRDIHASAQQVQGRTGHIEICGQHFLGLNPTARFI